MTLLDLFCCAGGAAEGYRRAGFTRIVGVDNRPQPRYPFDFIQADALEYAAEHGAEFDAIHASPPCQAYSHAAFCRQHRNRHPDLIGAVRQVLEKLARPWVIENIVPAPLSRWSIILCGLMFGLKVFRHRRFESSTRLIEPEHPTHRGLVIGKQGMCCVVGHGGGVSRRMREQINRLNRHGSGGQQSKAEWAAAMGIDWMTRNELAQAIPPAYTEWVGRQLLHHLRRQGRGERFVVCPACRQRYAAPVARGWYRRMVRRHFGYPELLCVPCAAAQDLARRTGLPAGECRSAEVTAR